MAKVLITCTYPRADIIVSDLNKSSISSKACPALTISSTNCPIPDGYFENILISSQHALQQNLPDLPVIAVGKHTAELARANEMYVAHTGFGGIQDLDLSQYKNILYPCAIEPILTPENTTPWPVYKSTKNQKFAIPYDSKIICVFSVKAAKIIKNICSPSHYIICLSQTIADIFSDHPCENLAVCNRPRYDIMKILIEKRYVQI